MARNNQRKKHWGAVCLPVIAFFIWVKPLHAETCHNDTIQSVTSFGSILKMKSGQVYQTVANYKSTSISWLAPEKVTICQSGKLFKITNSSLISRFIIAQKQPN